MSDRTRLAVRILAAALMLGVLGDALLRETPWGLNFFLGGPPSQRWSMTFSET